MAALFSGWHLFAILGVIGVLFIIRLVPGAIQSIREARDELKSSFAHKPKTAAKAERP
jgi:hypothetical protein